MFFHRLTKAQKSSFLALATKMLLADGHVAPEEDRLLARFRRELGDDIAPRPEEIHGAVSVETFDSRESRIIAVVGFLVMGFIDKTLHVDENVVFDEVASAFEFTPAEIESLRDWASRHADMLAELDDLVND